MKKIIVTTIIGLLLLSTGCSQKEEVQTFSFGKDLVFTENDGSYTINVDQSSEATKKKYITTKDIFSDKESFNDTVAITTTTANILEQAGITPIGAPESPSLNKDLKDQQYTLDSLNKIDKTKVLNIGSAISPNIEVIIELQPKLVLYSDAMPKSDMIQSIESTGLLVKPLPQSDYIDMFILLDVLAKTEKIDKANVLLGQLVKELKQTTEIIEKSNKKEQTIAILQVSDESIRVNNDETVLGRLTNALGMKNIFGNAENAELNKEQLLLQNPDFIIYYGHGANGEAIQKFDSMLKDNKDIFRELDAVKNNKAFPVQSEQFVFSSSVDFDIVKIIEYLAGKFYE